MDSLISCISKRFADTDKSVLLASRIADLSSWPPEFVAGLVLQIPNISFCFYVFRAFLVLWFLVVPYFFFLEEFVNCVSYVY